MSSGNGADRKAKPNKKWSTDFNLKECCRRSDQVSQILVDDPDCAPQAAAEGNHRI